jgi:hypothetical protein
MEVIMSPNRGGRRRLATAALVAASAATFAVGVGTAATPASADAPDVAGWYIDVNRVTVHHDDGDTPMMSVLAFRTRLGVPGTTTVRLVNPQGVDTLCEDMSEGQSCGIPDATGRANFGSVNRPTLPQMTAGVRPDVVGTVQLAFEDDSTDDKYINQNVEIVRSALQKELAAISEKVTGQTPDKLTAATDGIKTLGDRVMAQIPDQPTWKKVLGFLCFWCDPDDFVGYKVTLMVGLDQSLQAIVDLNLLAALRNQTNIAAAVLWPRNLTPLFSSVNGLNISMWSTDEVIGRVVKPPVRLQP